MGLRQLATRVLHRGERADGANGTADGDVDSTLRAADRLVGKGHYLEAIDVLTRANRRSRDARLERRLVELRFAAFRALPWPVADAPPGPVEDLFPGALIPEVDRSELDAVVLQSAIQHHGSLLVRGLVGPAEVDRIVGDVDAAFDAFDADPLHGDGTAGPEHDGWFDPVELMGVPIEKDVERKKKKRAGGGLYAVESPAALFGLIEVFTAAGLGDLARAYLGEAPMILARKVTLRRMPRKASGGWHQDGAFMGADLRALNVWLALSDCGVDAPSLDVVGRRVDYIVETGGHSSSAYSVAASLAEEVGGDTIVRPVFRPGDALLFDHMCLHRTGGGKEMTKGRYAIEMWFMSPSTYGAMTAPVERGFQPFDQQPLVF